MIIIPTNEIRYASNINFTQFMKNEEVAYIKSHFSEYRQIHLANVYSLIMNVDEKLIIGPTCTWDDIKNKILQTLRHTANNSHQINDVAFNETGAMTLTTELLDTRPSATRPFDAIPDGAVIHIAMIHRIGIGWKPLLTLFY